MTDTASPSVEAPESVPEWAKARAMETLNRARRDHGWPAYPDGAFPCFPEHLAIARLIAAHEQPPVDPLDEAYREIIREHGVTFGRSKDAVLAALRRGIELGRQL